MIQMTVYLSLKILFIGTHSRKKSAHSDAGSIEIILYEYEFHFVHFLSLQVFKI